MAFTWSAALCQDMMILDTFLGYQLRFGPGTKGNRETGTKGMQQNLQPSRSFR